MKRFLFITHSFPAFHSANSLCDEEIIKAKKGDVEIHVLCYQFNGQSKEEIIDGVFIHRIKKDWFWPIERNFRTPSKRNVFNKFCSRLILRFRQFLYLPFFPNYDILATKHLYRAAKRIVLKERICRIISDYNGCDTLISGMKVSKATNTDFVPIFWDPLSVGFHSKYVSKKFNNKKKTLLENQVLEQSIYSIMMCTTKAAITNKYATDNHLLNKIVFLDIPFYKHRDLNCMNAKSQNDIIRIVYGGATKERNIKPFVNALSNTNLNVTFDFYTIDHTNKELKMLEKEYKFFHVHKALPKNLIEIEYSKADILVNFGVRNPNTISCKIFDYFSFCKPVISTFSITNESCISYVEKYPLGYLFNENTFNVDGLRAFIETIKNKKINQNIVDELFKMNTATYFWESLNK